MEILDLEFSKVGVPIENIINQYGSNKLVGVISDINIKNDRNKCIGKIILLLNEKKKCLLLNQIVEFNNKHIKWSHSYDGNDQFHIISDHWVKPFVQDTVVEVPIKVYDIKTQNDITIMRKLTYKQFQANRLLEFYGEYNYRFIEAYHNFTRLYKNNQRYYAINATVKNYRIPQQYLESLIGVIGNEKRKIKTEWVKYLYYDHQKNNTLLKVENLINRYNSSDRSNVVHLKQGHLP